jgi:hypothetical protein
MPKIALFDVFYAIKGCKTAFFCPKTQIVAFCGMFIQE